MALRSALLVLLLALTGPVACKDLPRAGDEKAVALLTPSAPLPAWPCVPFEQLRRHLPSAVEGLQRTRDEGTSGRYGEVSISEAERSFKGAAGEELSVRIVDATMVDDLGKAIRAAANEATTPLQLDHAIGFVRFDPNQQQAEANLLIADRFVVAITGRGYEDTAVVRRIAEQMDVDGLALLR